MCLEGFCNNLDLLISVQEKAAGSFEKNSIVIFTGEDVLRPAKLRKCSRMKIHKLNF